MFDRIFANYLVKEGKLTENHLGEIFSAQEKRRVRLGVIAVSEKLMTVEQVEEVNSLQAVLDKRFGDIAIEKGYLTDEQVSRLLVLQGNSFLAFMQSTIDCGAMDMTAFEKALEDYQKENNFTLSNMEGLKSCDIDKIVPIFVYDRPQPVQELCGIMVRTISRLVDYRSYIAKPAISDEVSFDALCIQSVFGDYKLSTAISGDTNGAMLDAAIGFAGKENIVEKEDCLDALCELINCVNGLFATALSSKNVDVDMDAPVSYDSAGCLKSEEILTLPVLLYGRQLNIHIIFDKDYTV